MSTKQNKTKQNKTKQNKTKQNKTKPVIGIKEQLDIFFYEHEMVFENAKRYAQYRTATIYFTVVGLGALLAITVQTENIFIYKVLCIYVMPIFIYIVSLYYVNLLYMTAKTEEYSCNIESEINNYAKRNEVKIFLGWNIYIAQEKAGVNLVVYACKLLLLAMYPPISILFGAKYYLFVGISASAISYPEWSIFLRYILPIILWVMYFSFGCYMVQKILEIKKNNKLTSKKKVIDDKY